MKISEQFVAEMEAEMGKAFGNNYVNFATMRIIGQLTSEELGPMDYFARCRLAKGLATAWADFAHELSEIVVKHRLSLTDLTVEV